MQDEWKGFTRVDESEMMKDVPTAVSAEVLTQVAATITELPGDKKFLRKIEKLIGDRKKMFFELGGSPGALKTSIKNNRKFNLVLLRFF